MQEHYTHWKFYIIAGPDEQAEGHYLSQTLSLPILQNVSLDAVAACLEKSHVLINTDSGIGHIASCFNLHIYTIFGPGDESQTAPFASEVKIIRHSVPCAPCVHKNTRNCDVSCLRELKPDMVLDAIIERENRIVLDK